MTDIGKIECKICKTDSILKTYYYREGWVCRECYRKMKKEPIITKNKPSER